jgi:hypothetical protein
MDLIVSYSDGDNHTRWGYLTHDSVKLFNDYLKDVKQQDEVGEGKNEILDANVRQKSRMVITVFLPDGRTGDAELRHLTIVPPFVQYATKPKEIGEKEE